MLPLYLAFATSIFVSALSVKASRRLLAIVPRYLQRANVENLVLGEFGTSNKYTSTESGAHREFNTAGRLGTF